MDSQEEDRTKDLDYWQSFVGRFFSEDGLLRKTYWHPEKGGKAWELPFPTLARYYHKHFTSGVRQMQLHFEQTRDKYLQEGIRLVECQKVSLTYFFDNGHQVIATCLDRSISAYFEQLLATGYLHAEFNREDLFELLEIVITEHTEYVPRQSLENTRIESPELKQSPTMSKPQSKRAQQQQKQQAAASKNHVPQAPIPKSAVNENGTTDAVWQFIEIVAALATMTDVFKLSHARGGNVSAIECLHIYCTSSLYNQQTHPPQQQAFTPNLPHQIPGQQPPHFVGAPPNNFLSPANPHHLNLPATSTASPATLSNHNTPAMQNMNLQHQQGQPPPGSMAAPSSVAMSHQASHQGTNPSAAGTPSAAAGSANVSPNVGVASKRRRPSGIDDGEVNGSTINGVGPSGGAPNPSNLKVKQSPRPGGKKARANG